MTQSVVEAEEIQKKTEKEELTKSDKHTSRLWKRGPDEYINLRVVSIESI